MTGDDTYIKDLGEFPVFPVDNKKPNDILSEYLGWFIIGALVMLQLLL